MTSHKYLEGLSWLYAEIVASLDVSADELAAYQESRQADSLDRCQEHLYRVLGSLKMAGCTAGIQLVNEMLRAIESMRTRPAVLDEACQVLAQAIDSLPRYLLRVQQGDEDHPALLMPLLNDLRAVQGEPLFSESDAFRPDLSPLSDSFTAMGSDDQADPGAWCARARKLSHFYQTQLIPLLKGEPQQDQIRQLAKVVEPAESLFVQSSREYLWRAAGGFFESLLSARTPLGSGGRSVLRALERELRMAAEQGPTMRSQPAPEALLRNLLYYVTLAGPGSARRDILWRLFHLDQSLPASVIASQQGVELEDGVVVALSSNLGGEVAAIKATLEEYLADDCLDAGDLRQSQQVLRRMHDSLGIANQPELQLLCRSVDALLGEIVERETEHPGRELVDQLAVAIVDLESGLYNWSASARQRSDESGVAASSITVGNARHQLLAEIFRELETLKNALLDHLEMGESSLPDSFEGTLTHLATVMYIAEMARSGGVVNGLRRAVGRPLDGAGLNAVADVLTGLERYIENCLAGRERHDTSLEWAEKALAVLDGGDTVFAGEPVEVPAPDEFDSAAPSDTGFQQLSADDPSIEPPAVTPDEFPMDPAAEALPAESELSLDLEEDWSFDSGFGTGSDTVATGFADESAPQESLPEPFEFTVDDSAVQGGQPPVSEPAFPPAATAAGGPAAEELDDELRDIFVEEAREVLDTLGDCFPRWRADPADRAALAETRRAFHTLKGSGRMVGAHSIGEFAWAMENLLNRVMERRLEVSGSVVQCLAEAIDLLPGLVDAFEQGHTVANGEVEALRERAERLARGESGDSEAAASEPAEVVVADEIEAEDRELREIFIAEARVHLDVVRRFLTDQRLRAPLFTPPTAALQSALHTLKGSTHMAGIEVLAQLITAFERLSRDLLTLHIPVNEQAVTLLENGVSCFDEALALLAAGQSLSGSSLPIDELLAACEACRNSLLHGSTAATGSDLESPHDRLLHAILRDGLDHLMSLDRVVAELEAGAAVDQGYFGMLAGELTGISDHATTAGCDAVVAMAHALEAAARRLSAWLGPVDQAWPASLLQAREALLGMCDALAAHQEMPSVSDELLATLAAVGVAARDARVVGEELRERLVALDLPDDTDAEIVELFLAEADELLEAMEHAFHEWREQPSDREQPETLKRALHTFKGGARMACLDLLADISHELESEVESTETGVCIGNTAPIATMLAYHDALVHGVEGIRGQFRNLAATATVVVQPEESESPGEPSAPVDVQSEPEQSVEQSWPSAEIIPFVGTQRGLDDVGTAAEQASAANQEAVRLAAPVLDSLVNLAGEASISRGQVEQHVNEFMFSLDEMEATIRRMHDQVRRLGIETDAQVMFRREQIEASDGQEAFDPLEMDRYSELQQLSRSLLESASDLQDLRDTLLDKARDAETLLLHQSRINTDLQESLMRTRMVPFSRMVPRLRRIVRQVSGSLGKQVNLNLESVEGELDRTILERIVPALEHMIRNAVDHGIESAEQRAAVGKNPEGLLSISLAREGGDVLIRLADDGRGLDVPSIRAKAVANGLITEQAVLSDHEIQQFIFAPGFSTSQQVTEVSGRGVGMDVVNSEVRQLGGSVAINSHPGAGTEFTLRLPFTLSINRALMIWVGEDSYALPLNTITGVTRIDVDDLVKLYQHPEQTISYGGEDYQVRYLGNLLSPDIHPILDTAVGRHLPVVLMRSDGRNYAVQVDRLEGSREIVVKTLGPQFSRVPGLSGATIMGDGRVVVILDLQALLREQVAMPMPAPLMTAVPDIAETPHVPTVMVVDDSVTVRKVTTRFLEREGYSVITAKDGIDAMRMLQDHHPDIMLLDIEMPRMDGFEVTRLVRSTQRLKDLPIVMITSRTGEKHREHALSLGADHYLGKPYQEEVLLEIVRGMLAHGRARFRQHQAG